MLWLKVYYNHQVLKIIWKILILTNHYATGLLLNNFFNNIKRIYQHAGKCDDQQNIKDILDDDMVFTPEEITDESQSVPMKSTPVKKPSASKSLCLFTNIFDVKKKTAKHRVVVAKSKRRTMKVGNSLWTKKRTKRGLKNQWSDQT